MNSVEFLKASWPSSKGLYVIMHGPYPVQGTDRTYMRHEAFESIANASAFALKVSNDGTKKDVYFLVHTLTELAEKRRNDGGTYLAVKRDQAHARSTICFHADVDCGWDKKKNDWKPYKTQEEGLKAIFAFCEATGLPIPQINNSGYGWHVFWYLETEIPSVEWRPYAIALQALMDYHGFKVDSACTIDSARVLRVVGTWNFKDPENPKKVKSFHQGEVSPNALILGILDQTRRTLPNQDTRDVAADVVKPTPLDVAKVCPTFNAMLQESTHGRGVVWMNVNAIALHTTGGKKFAHKVASTHPLYDREETEAKLDAMLAKALGPSTCGALQKLYEPDSPCLKCAFFGQPQSSPVVFARRKPTIVVPEELKLPPGYSMTSRGIELTFDGKPVIVCPYQIYPTGILDEEVTRTKSTSWVAEIPRRGQITFSVPANVLNDPRGLNDILSNQSMYLGGTQIKKTGEFMSLYIRQLQLQQEERKQYSVQGWDKEYKSCLVGDTLYTATGSHKVDVARTMINIVPHLQKKGTLAGQIETMKFYENPGYVQQQFMIGVSLGAVLMFMTQYFGVIVNFSGDTGVAKSTVITAGANQWGDGEKLLMNGTAGGMTANAKAGRIAMYANIPAFLDEITLMEQAELREMTMGITQRNPFKVRNFQNGTERELPDTQKATVLICTSNQSPHDQLSQNSLAGTAGPARIFNAHTQMTRIHTKTQADAFILAMRRDQGHIGPEMLQWVLQNMDAVRAELAQIQALVDRVAKVTSGERYWAVPVVLSTLALRICKRLGLLNYDDVAVLAWGIDQIAEQRAIVAETYSDPVDILHGYVSSIIGSTLIVTREVSGTWYEDDKRKVQGQIRGRYEIGSNTIYLSVGPFKEYCDLRKIPHSRTERALIEAGVVTKKRIDLTRNTPGYPPVVATTLVVNLGHAKMASLPAIEDEDGKVIQLLPKRG